MEMTTKNSCYSVQQEESSSEIVSMTTTTKEEKTAKTTKRCVKIMVDEDFEGRAKKEENEETSNLTGMHSLFTKVFHTTSQESISEADDINNLSDLDANTKLSKSDGNLPKRCVEEIYSSNHVSFVSSANLIVDREFDVSVRKMSKSMSGIELISNEETGRIEIKPMEIDEN